MLVKQKCESSDIQYFEYDPTTKKLLVEFKGNRRWTYLDVPESLVRKFQKAESFGKFFNSNVRGQFVGLEVVNGKDKNQ